MHQYGKPRFNLLDLVTKEIFSSNIAYPLLIRTNLLEEIPYLFHRSLAKSKQVCKSFSDINNISLLIFSKLKKCSIFFQKKKHMIQKMVNVIPKLALQVNFNKNSDQLLFQICSKRKLCFSSNFRVLIKVQKHDAKSTFM